MERGIGFMVMLLQRICFIGILFLLDSSVSAFSFHRNEIGRVDVTKYATEHSSDDFILQGRTNCAPVSYNSLTRHLEHVGQSFLVEAKDNLVDFHGDLEYKGFMSHMTINHHGLPDLLTFSGPMNGFAASFDVHWDTNMYLCAHTEPVDGFSNPKIAPKLSIDWISFYNAISSNAKHWYEQHLINASGSYSFNIDLNASVLPATMLVNMALTNYSRFAHENAVWINYCGQEGDSVLAAVNVASNSTDTETLHEVGFTFSTLSEVGIHDGVPSEESSYVTENGNLKLELAEGNAISWTLLCTDKPFAKAYTSTPYVFISVSYREGNTEVADPAITGWVEFVNEIGFRACVGRPRYAGVVPEDASTPFVEYLVISQDGVYDSMLTSNANQYLYITMELSFPKEPTLFLTAYKDHSDAVSDIIKDIAPDVNTSSLLNFGYIAKPHSSNVTYLLLVYNSVNNESANYLESQLSNAFRDGFFPYLELNDSSEAVGIIQAMYPDGAPTDDQKVNVQLWTGRDCAVSSFSSGICSLESCNNETSGIKTISRTRISEHPSASCPPLSLEIACNLPPCSIEALTYNTTANPYEDSGSDLTWLWAVIGVVGGLVVIGAIYGVYLKTKKPRVDNAVTV